QSLRSDLDLHGLDAGSAPEVTNESTAIRSRTTWRRQPDVDHAHLSCSRQLCEEGVRGVEALPDRLVLVDIEVVREAAAEVHGHRQFVAERGLELVVSPGTVPVDRVHWVVP